ncbi:MAG: HAD family hydrolase [Treponema sp.]|jgi:putative hydrolase of the HAD superfamily|nr:HAD family hydrolase [Treponema sp.]
MIKAVFFDVGGVLHTSSPDEAQERYFVREALSALAKQGQKIGAEPEEFIRKLKIRAKEYKRWSEETTRELPGAEIWTSFFLKDFDPDPEKVAPCAERLCYLYDGKKNKISPRPGLAETVEALHRMGMRQGIISNIISKTFVPECLRNYGIEAFMECVIMSSVAGRRKPAPEIFKAATDALGLGAGECAFVGDRLSRDVIGAKNAGFGCMIQIRCEDSIAKDRAFEASGYRPDFMIDDLAEIPPIIRGLNAEKPHA